VKEKCHDRDALEPAADIVGEYFSHKILYILKFFLNLEFAPRWCNTWERWISLGTVRTEDPPCVTRPHFAMMIPKRHVIGHQPWYISNSDPHVIFASTYNLWRKYPISGPLCEFVTLQTTAIYDVYPCCQARTMSFGLG
jgi:hypothetical protein